MLQKLWNGVSLAEFNKWHPLTGKILITPEKYIEIWPEAKDWFETFALRAQNDINAYLNFILYKFPFEIFKDERIKETLIDMVFVCVEHWVYNRTPIEFNSDASMTFNNGQTQLNSFSIPTINIWDLAPSRMKILANLTQLKDLFDSYDDEKINLNLIDLNEFYTRTEVNALLDEKQNIKDNNLDTKAKEIVPAINEVKSLIPDVTGFETKEETNNFLKNKQNKLIAGANITINENNVISATGKLDALEYYKKIESDNLYVRKEIRTKVEFNLNFVERKDWFESYMNHNAYQYFYNCFKPNKKYLLVIGQVVCDYSLEMLKWIPMVDNDEYTRPTTEIYVNTGKMGYEKYITPLLYPTIIGVGVNRAKFVSEGFNFSILNTRLLGYASEPNLSISKLSDICPYIKEIYEITYK